jgi:hypothetical protein
MKTQLSAKRAAAILRNLAAGINPLSGRAIDVEGPLSHPLVVSALSIAASALEEKQKSAPAAIQQSRLPR